MRVHRIDPYIVNGTMAMDACACEINKFICSTEEAKCVLLLSFVGNVGLNMTYAKLVLIYVRWRYVFW